MPWEEEFADAAEMIGVINERLKREQDAIRYVNVRYKCRGENETKWLYDVKLAIDGDRLLIESAEGRFALAADTLEYLKLRPFYYAACVGFKEMVLTVKEKI